MTSFRSEFQMDFLNALRRHPSSVTREPSPSTSGGWHDASWFPLYCFQGLKVLVLKRDASRILIAEPEPPVPKYIFFGPLVPSMRNRTLWEGEPIPELQCRLAAEVQMTLDEARQADLDAADVKINEYQQRQR